MNLRQVWQFILAGFLILVGGIILLNNLNIIPWDITSMQWFWLLIFGGAGVAFVSVFLTSRENWWAVIPGFTLLGLAVLASDILPGNGLYGGAVFLGMIGLSFWLIYFQKREFWWAIIPGGVLVSLALVTLVSDWMNGNAGGAVLFLGMGVTFLLVYVLTKGAVQQKWAVWPAGVLGILGLALTLGAGGIADYIFPAALILIGGWLVLRAVTRKNITG